MPCSPTRPEARRRRTVRRTAALLLLGGMAACRPAPPAAPAPPPAVPGPVSRGPIHLDDDGIAAAARLLRLEDRREFAEPIAVHLRHAEPEIRARAAHAAARVGDRRAVPLLIERLAVETDAHARAAAAFALGQLGDTALTVVAALRGTAREHREGAAAQAARAEAAAALGRLPVPAARAALEELLAGPLEGPGLPTNPGAAAAAGGAAQLAPPALIAEALLAVWRLPQGPLTVDHVVPYLSFPDPEIRWRAAYALMRMGDPRTLGHLADALLDPDLRVRGFAARGLRAEVTAAADAGTPALAALLAALDTASPRFRIDLLRVLGGYRGAAAAAAVAGELTSPHVNVAVTAAEALGTIGGALAVEALDAILRAPGTHPTLRGVALAALMPHAPARGLERAAAHAASDDWLTRIYAARALARSDWPAAAALFRILAGDADPRVAGAALGSLSTLAGDTLDAARPLFLEALAAADPVRRNAALHGLTPLAEPGDLPLLLEAYERALADRENDALLAALDALGTLASRGMPVVRGFALRFQPAPDPLVRERARARLGQDLGWPAPWPADASRDDAFYDDIIRTLVAPALAGAPPPTARIHTAAGILTVELAAAEAPLTTANFLRLAGQGYFDGLRWHRVVPGFVVQDGDPRGDGSGGPGYAIRDEMNRLRYLEGTMGMALSGPHTGGSQFFIAHAPQPHLDGGYTVFGRLVDGFDVLHRIVQDDPIQRIEVR
jgi:cyclophilin family peptidyl-prolyl cis-trans isomerase/HEAT repeat protein